MSQSADCIFCKIVAGDLPSAAVLKTDDAIAFLDIGPLAPGHLLLIPRDHYVRITDMPTDVLQRVTQHLPALANAVVQAAGADGFNVLQNNGRVAGQIVDHVHFHIIPRRADDGLGYRWNAKEYNKGEAEDMRKKIESALAD